MRISEMLFELNFLYKLWLKKYEVGVKIFILYVKQYDVGCSYKVII